jgi:hypothetical protein
MADYPYLQENQCGTYIRDEGTQGVWSTKRRNQRSTIKCPVIGQFSKFNIHMLQVKKFARYTWWSDYLHNNDVRKIIINVLTHLVPSNTPTVLQRTSLLSVLDSSSARVSQPNLVQFMCKFFTRNASPSDSCTLSLPKNWNLERFGALLSIIRSLLHSDTFMWLSRWRWQGIFKQFILLQHLSESRSKAGELEIRLHNSSSIIRTINSSNFTRLFKQQSPAIGWKEQLPR